MDTTNDNFTFTCPHCEQHLEAEPDMAGMELDCPTCGQKIIVPQPRPEPVAPTESGKSTNKCWHEIENRSFPNGNFLQFAEKPKKTFSKWTYAVVGAVCLMVASILLLHFVGETRTKQSEETLSNNTEGNNPLPNSKSRAGTPNSPQRETEEEKKVGEQSDPLKRKAKELYVQGIKYYLGYESLKDYSRAFTLIKEAADLGDSDANAQLAWMYMCGDGCKENALASVRCAEKACYSLESDSYSYKRARMILGIKYFFGFRDENDTLVQDYNKAYLFFSESTSQNRSCLVKGLMEYHGVGTEKNAAAAADSFYNCCKDMPNKDEFAGEAAMCLGQLYFSGEGVSRNQKEAFKWFRYGARTAYPKLVAEAKKPLTYEDIADFNSRNLISFTAFSWKMVKLIGYTGVWGEYEGKKVDLTQKALRTYFNPDCWPANFGLNDM